MGTIADRAIALDGTLRSQMVCNQFVNEVLYHTKNGKTARQYLTWGLPAHSFAEGVVIVNKGGTHMGIFINDHEFMHSSLGNHQVVRRGSYMLTAVFGPDYVLRQAAY